MEIKNDKFFKMNDKKKVAKNNANLIMMDSNEKENYLRKNTLINLANNILKCLDFWQWDKYEKSKILDLKKVYRCKDLFCSNCRTVKILKAVYIFKPYFNLILDNDYSLYFMTLTVPNCDRNKLSQEIDKMNKGFRTM